MKHICITVMIISLTVILFLTMRHLYMRFSVAFLHPVLTSTLVISVVLIASNTSYEAYMVGGKRIEQLLGPAVVALSYPLYNQWEVMMKYRKSILLGVSSGLITAMGSVFLFAKIFKVEQDIIYSMIPKSITTPIAIQLSETIGGMPSMTAVFVMIAGFSGVIIGPFVMKYSGIESALGKGLALGSASHALGVAKSTEYGEFSLSIASVSMTLSAIVGSIIGFILVP